MHKTTKKDILHGQTAWILDTRQLLENKPTNSSRALPDSISAAAIINRDLNIPRRDEPGRLPEVKKYTLPGMRTRALESTRSRPQSPRSFWPVAGIESTGLVQHWKSAIHGLPVKSSKSDWLRIRNECSAHAQRIESVQSSRSLPQARRIVGSGTRMEETLCPFSSSEAALLLVSTKNRDLWPGSTPEVRASWTSRHSAHAQSQVWFWSQSIVVTKPIKTGVMLDRARGRNSWC